ncbi:MAG TPA: hypothetical protein VFT43_08930, partial [Candidatus Polarisedimenticolia bacterium]|nr:hypothetical protein [Candidatus Polarisedimenticolia bacterium]
EPEARDTSIVWTRVDLERYLAKWKIRDGGASVEISDYFCEFAAANPTVFLEVMGENRGQFDGWLHDLGDLSFVDFGGCMNRECLKEVMLKSLGAAHSKGEGERIRLLLLGKLRHIVVRKVD